MCLGMKNICEKFRCKQTNMRKFIALAFTYVNPHSMYLNVWRIYASISTEGMRTQYKLCFCVNLYKQNSECKSDAPAPQKKSGEA